jgi:8-oxo-dGTP diphosphatase
MSAPRAETSRAEQDATPRSDPTAAAADDQWPGVGPVVALAVVAAPAGVLAGRRRHGVPLWVFPGGKLEPGESLAQAAARECREETGLHVRVEQQIGRRTHPVTGREVVYLACTLTTAAALRGPHCDELAELRWLDPAQVDQLMPDLDPSVRDYLHRRYLGHPTRPAGPRRPDGPPTAG